MAVATDRAATGLSSRMREYISRRSRPAVGAQTTCKVRAEAARYQCPRNRARLSWLGAISFPRQRPMHAPRRSPYAWLRYRRRSADGGTWNLRSWLDNSSGWGRRRRFWVPTCSSQSNPMADKGCPKDNPRMSPYASNGGRKCHDMRKLVPRYGDEKFSKPAEFRSLKCHLMKVPTGVTPSRATAASPTRRSRNIGSFPDRPNDIEGAGPGSPAR